MKLCKNCNIEINPRNKFCSSSCSAKFNNKNRVVSDKTKKKQSIALKDKFIVHPKTNEILKDYDDGMKMNDIGFKYHIGQRRLRNMLKRHNVLKNRISNKEKICEIHCVQFQPIGKNKNYRCKQCDVEYVTKRKNELKIKAVEYKGGKCVNCGYNKSMSALEFHHIDPNIKEQNIARYSTRQWESVKIELDKCILVCANCHREIHDELRKST